MARNKLKTKRFCKSVADEITKKTDVKNRFSYKNEDALIYDFQFGNSYMTNNNATSLYFAIVNDKGKVIWQCTSRNDIYDLETATKYFINQVVGMINQMRGRY